MKLSDPRLTVLAQELGIKALSPVIAVAALVREKLGLAEAAVTLRVEQEAIRPIYERVSAMLEAERAALRPKNARPVSRMPVDWRPSDDDIEYARKYGFTADEINAEAVDFVAYWRERGEARGGWSLTWKNRIRMQAERLGKVIADQHAVTRNAGASAILMDADKLERAIATFKDIGAWPASLGPAPGQPGCLVPREALVKAAG